MEALGISANILAVLQASKQVIHLCTKYIEGVQDAPKDLRHILIEVSALGGLFEPLKVLVGFDSETAILEAQLSAPIEGCLRAVRELDNLLGSSNLSEFAGCLQDHDGDEDRRSRGKRRKLTDLKLQLAWPLKRERAKRLLGLLAVYKSTINLLLSSHGISQLQKISHDMRSFRTCLDNAGRRKILNWLVTVNPSFNHNQALDLHQDGTCKWVLLSKAWRKWQLGVDGKVSKTRRGIWIYGIPGAGKTILASFLITKMKRIVDGQCNDSDGSDEQEEIGYVTSGSDDDDSEDDKDADEELEQDSALEKDGGYDKNGTCGKHSEHDSDGDLTMANGFPEKRALPKITVYYYCHHARNHDEMGHFLAWILSQLCTKAEDIPERICDLFETDCRPSSDDLVDAIKKMATQFSKILVCVDAVDESQNREALAKFLKCLATDPEFGSFHVVVTSRREMDIERHLCTFTELPMSNRLVDRDIKRYLVRQLKEDRTLCRFSAKLRDDIEESLLSRANGMFRLVICQLQVLKKMPLESTVWKALEQLPETLDETYDRILASIPHEWAQIVRSALCLLTCRPSVPIKELIVFASRSYSDDSMAAQEGEGPSEEAFEEVMGCLTSTLYIRDMSTWKVKHARLAHYTIKEYIGSSRISSSAASFFYLPAFEAMSFSVKAMFRAQICSHQDDEPGQQLKQYCLEEFSKLLKIADTVIASNEELTTLISTAMDPRTPEYTSMFQRRSGSDFGAWLKSLKDKNPVWVDIAILTNLITKELYATTTAVLLQYSPEQVASICSYEIQGWEDTSMMAWLARNHLYSYLLLVLERCGAQLGHLKDPLLLWALERFDRFKQPHETLSALISAKVSVNPKGVRVTPLQLAVAHLQIHDVKVLLENGADPNAVGCPDGWIPYKLRYFEGGLSPLSKLRENRLNGSGGWGVGSTEISQAIEDLLIKAGGYEVCVWRVNDLKEDNPHFVGNEGLNTVFLSLDGVAMAWS